MKVAFASSGEEKIGRSREDSAIGDIGHCELPLFLAGIRIERDDRAVPGSFRPRVERAAFQRRHVLAARYGAGRTAADKAAAFFVVLGLFDENARIVFPRRNIEEPGPWAIRR